MLKTPRKQAVSLLKVHDEIKTLTNENMILQPIKKERNNKQIESNLSGEIRRSSRVRKLYPEMPSYTIDADTPEKPKQQRRRMIKSTKDPDGDNSATFRLWFPRTNDDERRHGIETRNKGHKVVLYNPKTKWNGDDKEMTDKKTIDAN
ncbi:unnamed protein product [Didymodactylos carnosus]|uniref:Uncharacterized protein n=1 Tax=Didymodactylos carnosus TaxID=1234261 RepID=A0A813XPW8_9BILA|nr:unnamed protein product [Didymodactylos carnosus]CAF1214307.1 unnamed protein product [Didymodactylos carnosus]CAF3663250.1 unnamed protein product [Didymodactylos carnosus]CAF4022943.1 unnamed protein product [Didymodactylos carnosus]